MLWANGGTTDSPTNALENIIIVLEWEFYYTGSFRGISTEVLWFNDNKLPLEYSEIRQSNII